MSSKRNHSSTSAQIVNRIFSGQSQIISNLNFKEIYDKLYRRVSADCSLRIYSHRPQMVKLKLIKCGATILFFNGGKIRLLGKPIFSSVSLEATRQFLAYILSLPDLKLTHTSSTCRIHIRNFIPNFALLYERLRAKQFSIMFEPEIFTAITILVWKPTVVNLFSNGKAIVLGKSAEAVLPEICDWLEKNCT